MANPGERITNVRCTVDELVVTLADGRLDIGSLGLVSAPASCHYRRP